MELLQIIGLSFKSVLNFQVGLLAITLGNINWNKKDVT
jgi:hypothetical protein